MEFKDFTVGYKGSFTKKVTALDNKYFADLSGDYNPIHFYDEVAQAHGFTSMVSNGFVAESRIAAALVHTFGSEDTLVLAMEKNTKFLKPVYMDDDITATVEVVGRIETLKVLKIKAECFNQRNERVIKTAMIIRILSKK